MDTLKIVLPDGKTDGLALYGVTVEEAVTEYSKGVNCYVDEIYKFDDGSYVAYLKANTKTVVVIFDHDGLNRVIKCEVPHGTDVKSWARGFADASSTATREYTFTVNGLLVEFKPK